MFSVKIPDAYVKLYPTDGYGSDQMLFAVMQAEKPDAIMHFTDPRFWGWLYAIEKQVRAKVPLTYLHICNAIYLIGFMDPSNARWQFLECCKCAEQDDSYIDMTETFNNL